MMVWVHLHVGNGGWPLESLTSTGELLHTSTFKDITFKHLKWPPNILLFWLIHFFPTLGILNKN